MIPDLLGGADTQMIGRAIWLEFFNNRDWPMAAAVTIVLLALLVVPIVYFQSRQSREQG
ncbi:Putrescine transport system permease protein PotH [compost metagenome]